MIIKIFREKLKKYTRDKFILVLAALFFAGFFLRVYNLSASSFWLDESFTLISAKAIYQHGYPELDSGLIEKKDILLPYLIAPFSSGDLVSVRFILRLPSVIFGSLSILLIFNLGAKLFNQKIGLISAFLLTFSYAHIAWTRQIRGYTLLVFFLLLGLNLMVYYEKKNKNGFLIGAITSFFLAFLSKSLGGIIFIPLAIYLFLNKKYLLLLFGGFFSGILFFFNKEAFGLFENGLFSGFNFLKFYLVDYLWQSFGLFFIFGFCGLYLSIERENLQFKNIHRLNFSLFSATVFFLSFIAEGNQKRYLFWITPILFLYFAYFINFIAEILSKKNISNFFHSKQFGFIQLEKLNFLKKVLESIYFPVILISFVIITNQFFFKTLNFIPQKFYFLEKFTPQGDFDAAYNFLKEKNKESDAPIISAFPALDIIYGNNPEGALKINFLLKQNKKVSYVDSEYYSNIRLLTEPDNLLKFIGKNDKAYLVIDEMGLRLLSRVSKKIVHHCGTKIFEKSLILDDDLKFSKQSTSGQVVYVYELDFSKKKIESFFN